MTSKNITFLILILCSSICNAQTNEKYKGCWLPEKYVLAIIANDTNNADKFLFPIEGFEILKESIVEFLKYAEVENKIKDVDKIVLIKTYKSEMNAILLEKGLNENGAQYRLPYFSSYLNTKYIPKETVERYQKAIIYLSKMGDKLVLEIVEKEKQEKIFFINKTNGYIFKTIEDAKRYLYSNARRF